VLGHGFIQLLEALLWSAEHDVETPSDHAGCTMYEERELVWWRGHGCHERAADQVEHDVRAKGFLICRVGQNHIYTVNVLIFWQANHQIYSHLRCIYIRFWPTLLVC